jgi:hypothetical protein
MVGTRVPFSAFDATVTKAIKQLDLLCLVPLSCLCQCILKSVLSLTVRADNYLSTRGK